MLLYFDFGRLYLSSDAVLAMFRETIISGFDEKKRGVAEAYKDAKQMFRDMDKLAQENFAEYYDIFLESKISFKAGKTKITAPGNLQEYFTCC